MDVLLLKLTSLIFFIFVVGSLPGELAGRKDGVLECYNSAVAERLVLLALVMMALESVVQEPHSPTFL